MSCTTKKEKNKNKKEKNRPVGSDQSEDSLNENGPHGFIYLNTWNPVGGTILEELLGVVSLEKASNWVSKDS